MEAASARKPADAPRYADGVPTSEVYRLKEGVSGETPDVGRIVPNGTRHGARDLYYQASRRFGYSARLGKGADAVCEMFQDVFQEDAIERGRGEGKRLGITHDKRSARHGPGVVEVDNSLCRRVESTRP